MSDTQDSRDARAQRHNQALVTAAPRVLDRTPQKGSSKAIPIAPITYSVMNMAGFSGFIITRSLAVLVVGLIWPVLYVLVQQVCWKLNTEVTPWLGDELASQATARLKAWLKSPSNPQSSGPPLLKLGDRVVVSKDIAGEGIDPVIVRRGSRGVVSGLELDSQSTSEARIIVYRVDLEDGVIATAPADYFMCPDPSQS